MDALSSIATETEQQEELRRLLRPLTFADIEIFPEDSLFRYEIIHSELVARRAPSPNQGRIRVRIGSAFWDPVESGNLGMLGFTPVDFELDLHNVVQPDVFFIAQSKFGLVREHVFGAPDFAVEVVDQVSRRFDYVAKRVLYESASVKEYWIVDPIRSWIDVLVLDNGAYASHALEGGVARSTVIPGVETKAKCESCGRRRRDSSPALRQ